MLVSEFKKTLAKLKKFSLLKLGKISTDLLIINSEFLLSGDFENQIKVNYSSNINNQYICKFSQIEKIVNLTKEDNIIFNEIDNQIFLNGYILDHNTNFNDFIMLDNIDIHDNIIISHKNLQNKLKLLDHSIDKNNPKFELNGAFFDIKNKKLVSTDTRRLHIIDINFTINNLSENFIVPKFIITYLSSIKNINNLKFEILDNICKIAIDNIILTFNLIIGSFPNYERITPQNDLKYKLNFDFNIPFKKNITLDYKNNDLLIYDNIDQIAITEKNSSNYTNFKLSINSNYLNCITKLCKIDFIYINYSNLPILLKNNLNDIFVIMPIVLDRDALEPTTKEASKSPAVDHVPIDAIPSADIVPAVDHVPIDAIPSADIVPAVDHVPIDAIPSADIVPAADHVPIDAIPSADIVPAADHVPIDAIPSEARIP